MTDARRRNRQRRRAPGAAAVQEELAYFRGEVDHCWSSVLGHHLYDDLKRLWEAERDGILADWIRERPGTRPPIWWEWDAPEKRRRRVGGIGSSQAEARGREDNYLAYGTPQWWITTSFYQRFHGGAVVDPDHPPLFESQAAYLDRHNLLTAAERKRLTPAAFEPEPAPLEKLWMPPDRIDAPPPGQVALEGADE